MPKTFQGVGKSTVSGTQLAVRIAEGTATVAPVMGTAFGVGASCTVPPVAIGIFVAVAVEKIRQVCKDWKFDSKQAESLPSEINECRKIIEDMFDAFFTKEEAADLVSEMSFLRVATKFIEMVHDIETLCVKWNNKKIHKQLLATNKYKKKFMELPEQLRNFKIDVLMAFEAEMDSYMHEKLEDLEEKANKIRSGVHDDVLAIMTEFAAEINEKLDTLQQNDEHTHQELDTIRDALTNLHMEKPPDSTSLPECPILYGREEELKMLNEVLGVGGRMAALVGGAGMGKSHCASHFARQWLREDSAHRFVLWLEADTENVVRVSYLNALLTLGVKLPNAKEELTIRDFAGLVWNRLHNISTQFEWMVVYNNVPEALGELDGPEAFAPLFFPTPLNDWGRGRILLTTRCASYRGDSESFDVANVKIIPIGPLDETTAVTILMDSLDSVCFASESETEAAKEVVKLFGYLPLAIAVANKQMAVKWKTPSEYLDDLKDGLESGVHDAVTLALTNALEYARNHGLGRVLDVAAFLSPDQLTLDLLDCDRDTAIHLCKLGLLQRTGRNVYSIHRMHQAAAQDGTSPSTAIGVIYIALERFDPENLDTWKYGMALIPHLDSLAEHVETVKKNGSIGIEFDNLKYARLLGSAAIILHNTVNDYSGAMVKYKESLAIMMQVYGAGAQNADLASTLSNLGGLEHDLGNYGKAQEYLEESLKMQQQVYGSNAQNAFFARTLGNLGNLENGLGNYKKAREYFEKSLKIKQSVYGADVKNANLALTLNHLGELEHKLGNYDKAREYYEKSLQMIQNVYGLDSQNVDLAATLRNLGALELCLGNYLEARAYNEKSLKMQQYVYGPDAQNTALASTLGNLGILEKDLGNYDKAREYYEESLQMMQHVYGPDAQNMDLASTLSNLGTLEHQLGNYDKARDYYEETLKMQQHVYGADAKNIDLARTLDNLGTLEGNLEKYGKALEYYEKSLEMKQQAYGPDAQNTDLARTLHNLGELESQLGNYEMAREFYKESLNMMQEVYGVDAQNTDLAMTLHNLGALEHRLGNYKEARAKYEDALDMMISSLGDNAQNHPQVQRIQQNINALSVLEKRQGYYIIMHVGH